MKLSKQQFKSFETKAASDWDRETAQTLLDLYPSHTTALGATLDDANAFTRTVRDYALAYGITTKRETFKLVIIGVTLGAHFPHDPRFEAGVSYCLGRTSIPQDRRLVLLGDFVEAWLSATWTDEGLNIIGQRLVERVRRPQDPAEALEGLIPQSPTIVTPDRRTAFFKACLSHADGYGLKSPHKRIAYVGAALVHGIYWFDDPLMARLRGTIEGVTSPDDLCERMSGFYEGFR